MTPATETETTPAMIDATTLPRLMHGASDRPLTLAQHEQAFASTFQVSSMLDELDASGLTGRGGAGFPTALKARLIKDQRGHNKFMVVNAMEGEPASHKDRTLLSANPHLMLDGAEYLASIIGANNIAVCVSRDNPTVVNHVERAIHERTRRSLRGPKLELHTPPVALRGGRGVGARALARRQRVLAPVPPEPSPRHEDRPRAGPGRQRRDLRQRGLIGRYGAQWYRGLGTPENPGTPSSRSPAPWTTPP